MIDNIIQFAILESIVEPIVFVDTAHIIRYMNPAAIESYQKRGYEDLVDKSLFDCHNERSKQIIIDTVKEFQSGVNEKFLLVNKENKRVIMRAVRNADGKLIGYYERFELIV